MADIIDFTSKRKKKVAKELAPTVTLRDVAVSTIEGLLDDWERMVRKNQLNEFFVRALPSLIDQKTPVNYMKDLNEVSKLETNLGMVLSIHAPGMLDVEQIGWIVKFKLGDEFIPTPDMAAEIYARTFAILAYISARHTAVSLQLIE